MKKNIYILILIFLIQNIYSEDLIKGLTKSQIISKQFTSAQFTDLITDSSLNELTEKEKFYFQILKIDSNKIETSQTDNKDKVSIIDINEECIQIISENLSTPPFYILKFDSKPFPQNSSSVQFIICDSTGEKCINNPTCKNNPIKITFKYDLEEKKKSSIKKFDQKDIDLFNILDPFFQDICFRFTSDEGTDILLDDRISNFYISNDFCSDSENIYNYHGHKFENDDLYVTCSNGEFASEKEKLEMLDFIDGKMNLVLKNSNFKVAKCWNLVMNIKNVFSCYTSLIMLGIFTWHLISLFIFFCVGTTPIKKDIEKFFPNLTIENETNNNLKKENNEIQNKIEDSNNSTENNNKEQKSENDKIEINEYEDVEEVDNNINVSNPPKYSKNSSRKYVNDAEHVSVFVKSTSGKKLNDILKKKKEDEEPKRLFEYNNDELNLLEFKYALKYDNRCCCTYYCDLLKYSNLILFTFCVGDDYNLKLVKICLFIFSFAMYLAFNCLLFNNSSMRKIYENNGTAGIIDSLPRIVASSILSTIILFFLKKLCLGKNGVREIRNETQIEKVRESVKSFLCCLKCRIWMYFNFSLAFLIGFWYFVSAFCIIYKNTQWIIIKDTLMSFAFGFIYPFIFCLIPTIFRNCGLCCKCSCCYCCSQFCQLF